MLLPGLASRCFYASMCLLSLLISGAALAETITVGGVGSLSPLLGILGEAFSRQTPGVRVVVIHPPLGSSGGMRALAAGKVDIALTGRVLKPEEAGIAKPWLQTPLVVATSGGKTKGLSRAQLADIYAGRKTAWDDGRPVRLVLRGAHESETQSLRSMTPEIDAAVGEALKRPDLPVAENDIEAIKMIAQIYGSFGTTTLGLINTESIRLDVVPIDGIKPSTKALIDGSYPWRRIYHLVSRPTQTPATTAFLSYLNSPAALALARKFEYVAAKP